MHALLGKRPKPKYHSYQGTVGKIAENLIDWDFKTTSPLQKWTTDLSQFSFTWGKCYLSPILDMHTNEVVSYDLSLNPNLDQIKHMLHLTFARYQNLQGSFFIQIKDGEPLGDKARAEDEFTKFEAEDDFFV